MWWAGALVISSRVLMIGWINGAVGSFWCVEGQRLEKAFLHSAVQINNAGMYAYTAAHQQAISSVVVKERKEKNREKIHTQ